MNKKGFAITTVLYSILIMFILLIATFLNLLGSKRNIITSVFDDVSLYYDMTNSYRVCSDLAKEYVTEYRGEYKISTPTYTGYLYLPANTKILGNDDSSIIVNGETISFVSNDNTQYKFMDIKNTSDYDYTSTDTCPAADYQVVSLITSINEVDITKLEVLKIASDYDTVTKTVEDSVNLLDGITYENSDDPSGVPTVTINGTVTSTLEGTTITTGLTSSSNTVVYTITNDSGKTASVTRSYTINTKTVTQYQKGTLTTTRIPSCPKCSDDPELVGCPVCPETGYTTSTSCGSYGSWTTTRQTGDCVNTRTCTMQPNGNCS